MLFYIASILFLTQINCQQFDPLDVPADTNEYSFTKDEQSPVYSARILTETSPYNANQNLMNLTYYTTYNQTRNLFRFYATLTLALEKPDVYSDVYMYLSFQPSTSTEWDIARCHVKYDGDVNLPFRIYNVTDHWSSKRPFDGGLDSDLELDHYQNWVVNQENSNSTCPGPLQKCVFNCQIARQFTTLDEQQDYDLQSGGDLNLNVAYKVYIGKTAVQSGASQFSSWRVPMFALNMKQVSLVLLGLIVTCQLF